MQHEVEGAMSKFVGLLAQQVGDPFFKAHLKINPILGVVDAGKGELANTLKTTAIFSDPLPGQPWDGAEHGFVLNYGFSDQVSTCLG